MSDMVSSVFMHSFLFGCSLSAFLFVCCISIGLSVSFIIMLLNWRKPAYVLQRVFIIFKSTENWITFNVIRQIHDTVAWENFISLLFRFLLSKTLAQSKTKQYLVEFSYLLHFPKHKSYIEHKLNHKNEGKTNRTTKTTEELWVEITLIGLFIVFPNVCF